MAVSFLVMFGGSEIYFPRDPKGRSAAEGLIGADKLRTLGARMRDASAEIPIPRTWLIRALRAEGLSIGEIARALKTSSSNVKRQLRVTGELTAPADPLQLSLFPTAVPPQD
ncbi:helix-turn-helix domain-containing protein [Sagittula sp. NFXS13]|uniref:helix-turn-helix domain-containing protein n=1 Tax=Sagittula sp. NFXS13 TaxID=2819095 RepID=UPI0032DE50FB